MLSIENLSLQRGGQWLLDDCSVTIQPGQRVALVGGNGTGKSSLFQMILGELSAEQGHIRLPGGSRLAHMAQEVAGSDRSARDFVLDGHTELRRLEDELARAEASGDDNELVRVHGELDNIRAWDAPREAEALLRGLAFGDEDMDRPVSDFSGGWRIRLNLAQALMVPSDLLLLDEPTNHLDIEACYWLEGWLKQYQGTLLFISHDRDFMDRVATHVIHFEHRKLYYYTGNYHQFERQRAERLARQQSEYEKQQKRVAEIQGFIDRFRAQANKAKQAQSRIKALERMETIAPAHVDSQFEFRFPEADKVSNPLLTVRDGAVGYDGQPLLSNIHLNLMPGSRVGLLGVNGAGKSTLIAMLRGATPLLSGERVTGEHFRPGYFAQHQLDELDVDASPFLHLRRLTPGASDQVIRNFLGGFGFRGDDAMSSIRNCSGGEKARLALAIIAWQKPNVLFLDEPTNHLDLEMRQALTMALQSFEGAMVLVSHDRHLLRNTVDTFWRVADGTVTEFDGDLDEYERWLSDPRRKETAAPAQEVPGNSGQAQQGRQNRKKAGAERRQKLAPYRKEAKRHEQALERINAEKAEVEKALGDSSLYEEARKDELRKLLARQAELEQKEESAEQAWLEANEAIEAIEAGDD
jgi:ATP-binding cassette subfamily F protein 3